MITGHIHAKENISIYPEAIQKAILYLKNHDLVSHEPGRFELDGENMILQVLDLTTSLREKLRPEVHRRYIDLQYLAAGGPEAIGWYPDLGDNEIDEDLLKSRDIIFYKSNIRARESIIQMRPGSYAAFFPCDVHIPAIQVTKPMAIRKIVIKVAVDTL